MSVQSGQVITIDFTTADPSTGAASNADSLPTGKLVVAGTDNAATVTITNKETGVYKAAVTLPSLSNGDIVQLRVAATFGTAVGSPRTYKSYVWHDSAGSAGIPGAGAVRCTQRILNTTTGQPEPDVEVWVTTDSGGNNVFAGTLVTDGNGLVSFMLNAGATYYLWTEKSGTNGVGGRQFTAIPD